MKRIRKYLIHRLGGVTEEENDLSIKCAIRLTRFGSIQAVLSFMKKRYGLPADEWCKTVYGYACEVHDQAEKELSELSKTNWNLETEVSDERN